MRFNRDECKVMHLGQNNQRPQHRLGSTWSESSLAKRTWVPGGQQAEHKSEVHHCSNKGNSDTELHPQGYY